MAKRNTKKTTTRDPDAAVPGLPGWLLGVGVVVLIVGGFYLVS